VHIDGLVAIEISQCFLNSRILDLGRGTHLCAGNANNVFNYVWGCTALAEHQLNLTEALKDSN